MNQSNVGADDLTIGFLVGCPFIGWKEIEIGKRSGMVMIIAGICLLAFSAVLHIIWYMFGPRICFWYLTVWIVITAGGALVFRGMKRYRRG